ncbi:hypothetical protein ACQRWP_16350 [Micromonospora trifolii]|uniref:hypothetical protein n=1 Tax=Micromonospora trifolii TaxID=2911208 RepID=UPI003D2EB155
MIHDEQPIEPVEPAKTVVPDDLRHENPFSARIEAEICEGVIGNRRLALEGLLPDRAN